jgi:hypothetical protein
MRTLQGKWLIGGALVLASGGCNLVFGLEHHQLAQVDGGAGGVGGGEASCSDGKKNGDETGVDCGGSCSVCPVASCTDHVQNGNESGVDCGGPDCPSCDGGAGGAPPCTSKPCVIWSTTLSKDDGDQGAAAVTTDALGNVLLTGSFLGTLDLGGSVVTSTSGLSDAFIARLGSSGKGTWSHGYGDAGEQVGHSITAPGSDGSVVFSGHFRGSVDLDGAGGKPPAMNGNVDPDYFVAGFDVNGVPLWSHVGAGSYGNAYVASSSGFVILGGSFTGKLDLCGGLTSAGTDLFVARLASGSGVCATAKQFGDAGDQELWSVATDSSNNVFIGGYNEGTFALGASPSDKITESAFIGKLGIVLDPEWGRNLASAESIHLAVDPLDGSVVVAGTFGHMVVDDGKGATVDLVALGSSNAYVLKYDASGILLWHKRFGTSKFTNATGVAVDSAGDIVLAGEFDGVVDFGKGMPLITAGDHDVFLVKLGPTGETQWVAQYGDAGAQGGPAVAVDPQRNIVIAGQYRGQLDFGDGALSSPKSASIFVAKFAP